MNHGIAGSNANFLEVSPIVDSDFTATMTRIYHITHLNNLRGIIAESGLWSDRKREELCLQTTGIAHQHIKKRRARCVVPVAAMGTLAEYVPFHFAPRSPMLYAIHKDQVEDYSGGQGQVLHLVSSVEVAIGLGSAWCFTDGHADMAMTSYYDRWDNRDAVDWDLMKGRWWNDTSDHPDRKRKRQAEFLVHDYFPWTAIEHIGVYGKRTAKAVLQILDAGDYFPRVIVDPQWYY